MKKYRLLRGIQILAMAVVAIFVFGFVTMQLWNWLMPAILGLHTITFWQALGLVVLSKILFGGFHRHGGRGGRRRQMKEQWVQMSAEEREKFRSGMRGRGWCRHEPTGRASSQGEASQGQPGQPEAAAEPVLR